MHVYDKHVNVSSLPSMCKYIFCDSQIDRLLWHVCTIYQLMNAFMPGMGKSWVVSSKWSQIISIFSSQVNKGFLNFDLNCTSRFHTSLTCEFFWINFIKMYFRFVISVEECACSEYMQVFSFWISSSCTLLIYTHTNKVGNSISIYENNDQNKIWIIQVAT